MPLRFSAFPETLPLAAAHLGEHNAEVLSGLPGYPAARIASLVAAGVLHANPET
jgi:crotonobetainyl-CoA:carnitine CoA-transferase CaiB-like acyl-CoA transferase